MDKLSVDSHIAFLQETCSTLEKKLRILNTFIDSSDAGMFICDYNTGEVLMTNQRYCEQTGMKKEEILGQKCWDINNTGQNTFCPYCPRNHLVDPQYGPEKPYRWSYYNEKMDMWLRCTSQAMELDNNRLVHIITLWDFTTEHQLQARLANLAYYDPQMLLPNRLKLIQDLDRLLPECQKPLYLICFDISPMRFINDIYGRKIGDKLLQTIINWIKEQNFGRNTIYRIEGDEFGLLLTDASKEESMDIKSKIFERFADSWCFDMNSQEISIYCTLSLSVIPLDSLVAHDELLSRIDRTMVHSRESGQPVVYDKAMDLEAREQILLSLSLKNDVQQNMLGFHIHYQPIVELTSGTWKGVEALCRWNSRVMGPTPPGDFIPVAEKFGLISKIGRWVLETAVQQCKEMELDALPGFFLSVNISPVQLIEDSFAEHVQRILKKYNFPGDKLNLEVTESTEMVFNTHTQAIIEALTSYGVQMSLDDFGTGYSSFNNLKNLSVKFVKTERAFIKGIEKDSHMQYFYYIMSELAHANDMFLIAEGVETQEQLEVILKNGADFIQGYYFSKPMSCDDLKKNYDKFTTITAPMYAYNPDQLHIDNWLNSKTAYSLTPRLFKISSNCMELLLKEKDTDTAFNRVLEMAGSYFGIGRAYTFIKKRDTIFCNQHEWCSPGVLPQKDNLLCIDVPGSTPSLIPSLKRDGMLISGDISRLPPDLYAVLKIQDINSIAMIPMWSNEELIGFVGFDDFRLHKWLPEEIIILKNLGMFMANRLEKDRLERILAAKDM